MGDQLGDIAGEDQQEEDGHDHSHDHLSAHQQKESEPERDLDDSGGEHHEICIDRYPARNLSAESHSTDGEVADSRQKEKRSKQQSTGRAGEGTAVRWERRHFSSLGPE